jgi:regulation of enolase protein 1 (concanavalin A-like superfamily)
VSQTTKPNGKNSDVRTASETYTDFVHQHFRIKSGIEFYQGKPYVATVGCDAWADWSLVPMPQFASGCDNNRTGPGATIEARREQDALGKSLWLYWITKDEQGKEVEKLPIREVTWAFADEEGWNVGIAGYVCRPTKLSDTGDEELLEAEFAEGLEIEIMKAE